MFILPKLSTVELRFWADFLKCSTTIRGASILKSTTLSLGHLLCESIMSLVSWLWSVSRPMVRHSHCLVRDYPLEVLKHSEGGIYFILWFIVWFSWRRSRVLVQRAVRSGWEIMLSCNTGRVRSIQIIIQNTGTTHCWKNGTVVLILLTSMTGDNF